MPGEGELAKAEPAFERVTLTCRGVRRDGARLFVEFADGAGAVTAYERTPALRRYRAGGVYTVERSGRTIRPSTGEFVEASADPAFPGWLAASDAALTAHRAALMEKQAGRTDRIADALAPLRREYQRLVGHDRVAFQVLVLRALERPVKKGGV